MPACVKIDVKVALLFIEVLQLDFVIFLEELLTGVKKRWTQFLIQQLLFEDQQRINQILQNHTFHRLPPRETSFE